MIEIIAGLAAGLIIVLPFVVGIGVIWIGVSLYYIIKNKVTSK